MTTWMRVSLWECIPLSFSTSASVLFYIVGWIPQEAHVSKSLFSRLTLNGLNFNFTLNSALWLNSSRFSWATHTIKSHAYFSGRYSEPKQCYEGHVTFIFLSWFFLKRQPIADLWISGSGSVRREALLINAAFWYHSWKFSSFSPGWN